MAMLKCGECGEQVSSQAKTCPKCGAPMPKRTSLFTWVIGAVMLVAVYQCTTRSQEQDQLRADAVAAEAQRLAALSPAERKAHQEAEAARAAAKAKEESEFQSAVRVARALKASMNNPDSFKLESLFRTEKGVLCFEYRASNSFNAVVLNYAVVKTDLSSVSGSDRDVAREWNAHCTKASGRDLSSIRHVL